MCLVINEKFTASYYGKANSYIQLKEYQKAIDAFNDSFCMITHILMLIVALENVMKKWEITQKL